MDSEEKGRDRKRRKEEMDEEKRLKEIYAEFNEQRLEEMQFEKSREVNLKALKAKILEAEKNKVDPPKQRPTREGSRCAADSVDKTWYCYNCGRDVKPERLLLVDLPRLTCPHGCGQKAPADLEFDFSMNRLEINGHCPIGNVKDQNGEPHCVLYSSSSAAEASWRVSSSLSGEELDADGPVFDMADVAERYEAVRLEKCINTINSFKWNFETLRAMKHLFAEFGAKSLGDDPKVHHFPHVSCIRRSFRAICKMLPQGFPMVTVIMPGENFANLQPGQIYRCPSSGTTLHSIVLIGAGRHEGVEYYHFLNSWGKEFCLPSNEVGPLGGYGLIYAEDILCTPLTFLRHESDLKDFKQYLLQGDEFPRMIRGRGNLEILPVKTGLAAFPSGVKKLEIAIEVEDFPRGLFSMFGIDDVQGLLPIASKCSCLPDILEEFAGKNVLGWLSLLFKRQIQEKLPIKGTRASGMIAGDWIHLSTFLVSMRKRILEPWKTRKTVDDKAKCSHPGSDACVGVRAKEVWKRVRYQLVDQALRISGLDAMGNQVRKLWTAEDKKKLADFEKLTQNDHKNPISLHMMEAPNAMYRGTDNEDNYQDDENNAYCSEDKGKGSRFYSKRFMSLTRLSKGSLVLRQFHHLILLILKSVRTRLNHPSHNRGFGSRMSKRNRRHGKF